jgi:16S rRNA (cytidine1402-2'-O)-methyltransferase
VRIETLLEEGKHVAFVTDAGTPGVSDPGLELVSRVREHFGQTTSSRTDLNSNSSRLLVGQARSDLSDVVIEAIPGPSALAAALSIAGLRASSFVFYGFLPLKKGRERLLSEIAASDRASVLYESPHRILKTLEWLQKHLGSARRIGVFRELTKMHEESVVGSADEVAAYYAAHADKVRGEFVVIVESQ